MRRASVGALAGTLLFAVIGHRLPRRVALAGAFIVAGLAAGLLAVTSGLAATFAVLAVAGFAIGPLNPLVGTLFQVRIPAELRGHVFGTILATVNAAAPLGILVAGYLVEATGLRSMLLGIASLLVLVAMLTTPAFRQMDRPAQLLGDKEH